MIRLVESLAGKLLVATPRLQDPNFVRTVVLMLMHDEQGALGVVLNRKLDLDVEQVLPAWAPHVAPPAQLFLGGPVEPTAAVAVARTLPEAEVPGFTRMGGTLGVLDLSYEPADLPMDDIERVRLFGGYAGWSGGQLERELEEEAWFVVPVEPDDPFTSDPDSLWRRVLQRQPGHLALFAFQPPDPSLN